MYGVRPVWESRRFFLAAAKPEGGGTASNPTIPSIFNPLINASVGQEVQQQGLNPLSQYDAGNPMGVQGLTPSEQLAMGYSAGGLQTSPLMGLAGMAAQNAAGMAGSGPLSGSYDPSQSMGLQDWMRVMNPAFAQGGEIGSQSQPNNNLNNAQGANGNPTLGGPANPPNPFANALSGSLQQALSGAAAPSQSGSVTGSAAAPGYTGPSSQSGTGGSGVVGQGQPGGLAYEPQSLSDIQRILGSNWIQNAQQAPQMRLPGFGQASGGRHEFGGNPAISQAQTQAGWSPQQGAQWLAQGLLQNNPTMYQHPGTFNSGNIGQNMAPGFHANSGGGVVANNAPVLRRNGGASTPTPAPALASPNAAARS